MNKIDVLIGKELKIARLQKKLSQQKEADMFGVSRQIISAWETGQRSMNVDDYVRLCETFGYDAQGMIDSVMEMVKEK